MESVKKWLSERNAKKNGLYVHYSPPKLVGVVTAAQLRLWARGGAESRLERAVLAGQGRRLLAEAEALPLATHLPRLVAKCHAMHAALERGSLLELQELIGADYNRRKYVTCLDEAGVGLLHKAIFYDYMDIAEWLVKNFPQLVHQKDSEGRTPLHYAGMCRDEAAAAALLEGAGAARGARDAAGRTPAYYRGATRTLLALPASPDMPPDKNPTGLVIKRHNIRIWCHDCDMARLQRVVWDGHGTKLLTEVSNQHVVKRFLEAVPYIMNTIRDIHGVVIKNDLEGLMKQAGDPVPPQILSSRDSHNMTVLHKAAGLGHGGILNYIVERYPQGINDVDNDGRTPLHYAAAVRDEQHTFNTLISLGADQGALDNKNRSPGYYINRPQDIDKNLLKTLPEAPRTASSAYPSNWDWKLLDSENIAEINKKSRRKNIKASNENISSKNYTNTVSDSTHTENRGGGLKGSTTHEFIKGLPELDDSRNKNENSQETEIFDGHDESVNEANQEEEENVDETHKDTEETEKVVEDTEENVVIEENSKEGLENQTIILENADNNEESTAASDAEIGEKDKNKDEDVKNCEEYIDHDHVDSLKSETNEPKEQMGLEIEDVKDEENTSNKIENESNNDDLNNDSPDIEHPDADDGDESNIYDRKEEQDLKNIVNEENNHSGEENNHSGEENNHSGEENNHSGEENNHSGEENNHSGEENNLTDDKEDDRQVDYLDTYTRHGSAVSTKEGNKSSKHNEDDDDVQVQGDCNSENSDINHTSTATMSDIGSAKRGNVNDGRNTRESLIKGVATGEVEQDCQDASITRREGSVRGKVLIVDNEIDPEVTELMNSANMEMLATLVLNGEGSRLIGRRSGNTELQAFLDNVPTYMQKINKIHLAAKDGNIRDLQAALDRRKFAIARDPISANGSTPLHVATIFGKTNIIKYLGGRFPETLSAVDFEGRTALHYAAVLPDNGHYYNLLQQLGGNSKDLDDGGKSAEDFHKNPQLLPFKQLLSDFGISEEASREMFSDKVPGDTVSARRALDIPEALDTIERCYRLLASARSTRTPLSASSNKAAPSIVLGRFLKKSVFELLKNRITKLDHDLFDVIWPAVKKLPDNRNIVQTVEEDFPGGITAPDYYIYDVFHEFLTPLIKDLHNINIQSDLPLHPQSDFLRTTSAKLSSEPLIELNIDASDEFVLSGTIECSRNIKGFELPLNLKVGKLETIERVVTTILMQDEFKKHHAQSSPESDQKGGTYYTLNEVLEKPSEICAALASSGLLIALCDRDDIDDSTRLHGKHWPYGRGVFVSDDRTVAVWVNVHDHIRVVLSTPTESPGEIGLPFSKISYIMTYLHEKLDFVWHEKLGHLSSRPTFLGAGIRFSLIVHFQGLSKDPENMKHLCAMRGLQYRETLSADIARIRPSHADNGHMDIPIFHTEEGRYLAKSLGDPLIKGLTEVANVKPKDPVAFLASFLHNFPENKEETQIGTQESKLIVTQEAGDVENEAPPLNAAQLAIPLAAAARAEPLESKARDRTATRPRPIDVVTVDPQPITSPDAPEVAFSSVNRDEHGQSMLHFAAARTHARNALFQLLQESDVNLGFRDELYRTARDVSIQANVPENTAEIDKWVLHLAARGNTERIMELMIDGYDHILDVVDEESVPITDVISKRGNIEMSDLLSSIPAFEESRETLHAAVRRGELPAVTELLPESEHTLARSRNTFGRTALHVAVLAQHEDIVAYLAKAFPELLRVGDNLERTPLHYAMGVEKIESLSRILIRAGAKRVLKDLKGRQPSYYFMNKSDILRLKEEEDLY